MPYKSIVQVARTLSLVGVLYLPLYWSSQAELLGRVFPSLHRCSEHPMTVEVSAASRLRMLHKPNGLYTPPNQLCVRCCSSYFQALLLPRCLLLYHPSLIKLVGKGLFIPFSWLFNLDAYMRKRCICSESTIWPSEASSPEVGEPRRFCSLCAVVFFLYGLWPSMVL